MTRNPQPQTAVLDDTIAADERLFRRNLIVIAGVHCFALAVFFVVGKLQPKPVATEVMWLDGGALSGQAAAAAEPEPETAPEPEPEQATPYPVPEPEALPPPASEIVEPKATPIPATPKPATPKPATPKPATPKPATPKPATPKPKPKATPTSSPKPKASPPAKPSSSPAPKKTDGDAAAEKTNAAAAKTAGSSGTAGTGKGAGKTGGGGNGTSEFAWYFEMLHDRFYSRWAQPVGIGEDVVTAVKLRIMKDGTIANRELVKSSGSPPMDESVMGAAAKVLQIDPLPAGLGNGEYLDINVNFKVDKGE